MEININPAEIIGPIRETLIWKAAGLHHFLDDYEGKGNPEELIISLAKTEKAIEGQVSCLDEFARFANEVTELEKEQEAICEKAQAKRGAESPDLKYIVRIHNKPDYPVTDFYISGGLGAARAVALDFEHRLDTPVSVRTLGGDYIPDYCRRPDGNCRACSLARPGGFDCEGAPLEDRGEGTAEEREGLPF